MPFYYTGCGGNDNNYDSENSCAAQCPSAVGEDERVDVIQSAAIY